MNGGEKMSKYILEVKKLRTSITVANLIYLLKPLEILSV